MNRRALLPLLLLLTAAALAAGVAACGEQGSGEAGRPAIVATHAILGAVVRDLVGGAAEVRVVMPAGADPHDFHPSARDVARLREADLVVANGLGLEEGFRDALEQAEADGVRVFEATDHVAVRRTNGVADPHFWTDPSQMRSVAAALAAAAKEQLGLDLSVPAGATDRRLRALDAEVARLLAPIPPSRRKLVTGHQSMGYFARRYGFTLVGAAMPGLSSQARVSASGLARLASVIEREGVTVVFAETGTPRQVADAIADETGTRVVELPSHALPKDGSYEDLMRETARRIAAALR